MADEIRIISVELNNYRQYYGKQKVEFSSREEGFTAIIGENGEGKSNLLNAINWCFYKNEPHGKKDSFISAPVINSNYLLEQGKGKTARTSVKVVLQVGDEQYSISRVLTILIGDIEYETLEDGELLMQMARHAGDKIPSGCDIVDSETDFQIKKRGKGETDFHKIIEDNNYKMNQILPRRLSVFFLLDGEFLEKFWDSFERVEEGIEEVSHLHLLSSAVVHVGDMNITRRVSLNDGSEKDQLQKKVQKNQYYEKSLGDDGNILWSEKPRWINRGEVENDENYHSTGTPRMKDLEHDIKKMQRRSQDISREISGVNTASAKVLQTQFEETDYLLQKAKAARIHDENAWRDSLIDKIPYVFAKSAIMESVKIIEGHLKKGELPNETKTTFTSDLLERGTCICDSDLKSNIENGEETNKERIAVEKARDIIAGDIGLDGAVKMRYSFKDKILDDYNGFLKKTFGDIQKSYYESKKSELDLNRKLKGIKDQLGDAGDKKIQELINEQDQLSEQIQTSTEEKEEIKNILAAKANENDECQQKIIRLSAKDIKAQKEIHETQIWNKAREQLQKVYDGLKKETREAMQDKTWEIFEKILYESDKFKKFIIKPDYSVILLNEQNQNHIVDISAGQSLFLALSFVTALREITGYKFPLVIDTPIGKISGSNQYNLAKILPSYLENEQISFLATDTEWVAKIPNISGEKREDGSFGELVAKAIPVKHFRIKQDKEGRSTIKLAEHKAGGIFIVK